jgi:signal recognition particle subunit SEC65
MAMVTTEAKRKLPNQEHAKGGPASMDVWQQRVEHALRHLGDRSILNRSPLARLPYIEKLFAEKYRGRLLPRGLALHDVLTTCVKRVSSELSSEPRLARACNYLRLVAAGANGREICEQLGLSREHISRVYRKQAIELVTEQFLSIVNNGK